MRTSTCTFVVAATRVQHVIQLYHGICSTAVEYYALEGALRHVTYQAIFSNSKSELPSVGGMTPSTLELEAFGAATRRVLQWAPVHSVSQSSLLSSQRWMASFLLIGKLA